MRPMSVHHEDLHPHTRLWFYALAWVDIDEAIRAARVCLHLLDKPPTREHFDHVELCVLRYGRPFAFTKTPSGKKRTRLAQDFIEIAEIDQQLHDRMIAMRNLVVAHSDMGHKAMRFRAVPVKTTQRMTIYECEPTWSLLTLEEVKRFPAIARKAVNCLQDVCRRLVDACGNELRRDDEGWLVLSPHRDD